MKDYSIPEEITIKSGMKSGNVRLTTTNNSKDDRYHRLVAVEIDDMNCLAAIQVEIATGLRSS